MLFLVPPERRPYELSYFCNFPNDVIVAVDKDTYENYNDWFHEFDNLRIVFLRKKRGIFSLFFHSTASDFHYDETQLINLIRKNKIDVILTVELFSFLSKQASILCKRFSLPHIVIVWENISSHPFYYLSPFKNNVDFVVANVSKIIAITNKSKDSLVFLKIPEEEINVVYPGVFLDKFRPKNVEKQFSLLFVGGLEEHKGFHLLLKTFGDLCKEYDDLTLGVAGDGKLKGKLFEMKRKCGNQRIVYLGRVLHSEIHLVYPKAEIFCFPTLRQNILKIFLIREEQFGFSMVEAMASGLPIVATRTDVTKEIVGGSDYLTEGNTEGLKDTISRLIEDAVLRRRLSALNRERAEKYFDAQKQSELFKKSVVWY